MKGVATVGRESRLRTPGKKINGRKRFIVTNTLGCCSLSLSSPPACRTAMAPRRSLLDTDLRAPVRSASPVRPAARSTRSPHFDRFKEAVKMATEATWTMVDQWPINALPRRATRTPTTCRVTLGSKYG